MSWLEHALTAVKLQIGQKVRVLPRTTPCPDPSHRVITHAFNEGAVVVVQATTPEYAVIPAVHLRPGWTSCDTDGDFRCYDPEDEFTQFVHHSQLEVID